MWVNDTIPTPSDSNNYWGQPDKNEILVSDTQATMPEWVFKQLKRYDHTYPTGQYIGKMWCRAEIDTKNYNQIFYLCWFDLRGQNYVIESREIIIHDWKKLMGIE